MAEAESPKETNFIEQIRKAYGHDAYTESPLARLAARYEPSFRMEQITRTSALHKEPKGWRDQFMCMISTRRQKLLHRRDWRSRSNEEERKGHVKGCDSKLVASGGLISANNIIPVPALQLGEVVLHQTCPPPERPEHNQGTFKHRKHKKLQRCKGEDETEEAEGFQTIKSPEEERKNDLPCLRPGGSCGELLLSSLLRPDPSAENFGFLDQDPHHKVLDADGNENAGGRPKGDLIHFNFAVTTAFNVPITGLMFPPLERRVRVCLFDGCNFLGNIHVFPAVTAIDEEDEPWVFVNKGASRCLVQYSSTEDLSLYIEVNVRYKAATEDEHREASEITCAWAMLDLPNNQADAEDLVSRSSLELPLLVGSLEHPVDVNTVYMPSGHSRVMVKRGEELSAIQLHWYKLSDFLKKNARLLPEIILASNEEVPFLVLYRKAFLDTLLDESRLLPEDAVFSPLIQLYPWMLNERGKQIQEVFKESWIARKLEWPPNTDCMKDKNRQKYLKVFSNSLLAIMPLLQSHNVRRPIWPFHSTFENFKPEEPSDIIGKKIDNEIGKSPTHNDSTSDDCSSSRDE